MDLEDLKCFTCRENRRQREKLGGEGEKGARITRNGHVALDSSLKFYEGESKVKSSKTGVTNSGIRRFIGRQPLLLCCHLPLSKFMCNLPRLMGKEIDNFIKAEDLHQRH